MFAGPTVKSTYRVFSIRHSDGSGDSQTMASLDAVDPERRRYPRVKIHIPVELNFIGAAPMRTATDEVSLCGCFVETMFTMEVGTKLTLAFSLKDSVVKCTAIVATKYPQVGNGIDFIDMTPEDRLKLNHHIAEQDERLSRTAEN